jgi:hypothetical protein
MVRSISLLALIGCVAPLPPEGGPCRSTDDCPTPQVCVAGTCRHDRGGEIDAAIVRDAQPDSPADAAIDAVTLPCTLDGLTCNPGPFGSQPQVFMCGSACFATCGQGVIAATARNACQAWSGRLAEVHDAATNACITAKVNQSTWFGLSQSSTATTTAAGWTWNGLDAVTYMNWHVGKPDDGGGGEKGAEQCAAIAADGTWDDMSCTSLAMPFVCGR